jgi:hypothetical protein
MDERARRIGQNEALFRQVNEEIETLERGLAGIGDRTLHIVCECGNLGCSDRVVVPIPTYEKVRSDSSLFFVIPGHEIPSVEDVVEESQQYDVVRKRAGDPRRLAEKTDPRG